MEIISNTEYRQLIEDPQTVIIHYGRPDQPKVFLKQDQHILKVFYPKKKWITSSRLRPPALRFYRNSHILLARGYLAPRVGKVQHCRETGIYLLQYPKIEGKDVQTVIQENNATSLLFKVAKFVTRLHRDGIFFRSIHLKNILYTKAEKFGLIDLSDVHFKSHSLSLYHRYRNLKHLFAAKADQGVWQQFGKNTFLDVYLKEADLPISSCNWLRYWLRNKITC